MKKTLATIVLVLLPAFFIATPVLAAGAVANPSAGSNLTPQTGATQVPAPGANGTIPKGGKCSTANGSDGNCAGSLICTNGTCGADPTVTNGNGTLGSPCVPPGDCDGSMVCDVNSNSCQEPTTAGVSDGGPDSGSPGTPGSGTTGTGAPGSNPNINGGFISLTTIPGLTDSTSANAPDIPTLLNVLYKFCVGAAAVLAIIQLIHAGILYAGGDNVGKKTEAKHLIYMSLGGLGLVLSPFLVYSLINPAILNLNGLNSDLGGLNVAPYQCTGSSCTGAVPAPVSTDVTTPSITNGFTTIENSDTPCPNGNCSAIIQSCVQGGKAPGFVCLNSSNKEDSAGTTVNSARNVTLPNNNVMAGIDCVKGDTLAVQCSQSVGIAPEPF